MDPEQSVSEKDLGLNPGQVQESSAQVENDPEKMRNEMVDTVVQANRDLEGQLVSIHKISESPDSDMLFMFKTDPANGGFGVTRADGPIGIDKRVAKELTKGDITVATARTKAGVPDGGYAAIRSGFLSVWEESFKTAHTLAQPRAERIRMERDVLPKALNIVKSTVNSQASK